MSTILIVDDRDMMRDSVGATLRRAGFEVVVADSGHAALDLVARRRPDAVVTDLRMPGMTGLELLEHLRGIDDELPVVLMTAYGSVETAVAAMKQGAFDYVTKPFEGDELVICAKRAVQHARTRRENALMHARLDPCETRVARRTGVDRLIGESPAMCRVKEQVQAVAASQGTVLIQGESGVGKEVVARAIHESSARAPSPFLAINCAALSESLLESELFGHEKGSFTGADRLRKGRFELADAGTLLLDEISEVPPSVQAKVLRVLQERAFERVGSSVTIGVDVRVLATSNRDLPEAVREGAFRQDLFFRLNVLPLRIPPLRERSEDVPALAEHFAAEICRREGRDPVRFDDDALGLLRAYHWPGNVRELQNICERSVVLRSIAEDGDRSRIPRAQIEPWLHACAGPAPSAPGVLGSNGSSIEAKPGFTAPAGRTLDEIERETIVQTLQRFNGHRQRTADALGIGVRTLGLKLKRWKEQQIVSAHL